MKRIASLIMLATVAIAAMGQEEENPLNLDISADIVSRYVWRGINLSESPAIQPTLSLTYKNITFGTWASYTFSRESLQEVDLFLSYETRFATFTLNNYYNPPSDTIGFVGNYFELSSKNTPHILEGVLSLNGPEKFPIAITAAVMFWGNDRGEDDKNFYSTYIETAYPFELQDTKANLFIGITPFEGFYYSKFGLVNAGVTVSKEIKITENYLLPIKGSFSINPALEKVFLVFSITL